MAGHSAATGGRRTRNRARLARKNEGQARVVRDTKLRAPQSEGARSAARRPGRSVVEAGASIAGGEVAGGGGDDLFLDAAVGRSFAHLVTLSFKGVVALFGQDYDDHVKECGKKMKEIIGKR